MVVRVKLICPTSLHTYLYRSYYANPIRCHHWQHFDALPSSLSIGYPRSMLFIATITGASLNKPHLAATMPCSCQFIPMNDYTGKMRGISLKHLFLACIYKLVSGSFDEECSYMAYRLPVHSDTTFV